MEGKWKVNKSFYASSTDLVLKYTKYGKAWNLMKLAQFLVLRYGTCKALRPDSWNNPKTFLCGGAETLFFPKDWAPESIDEVKPAVLRGIQVCCPGVPGPHTGAKVEEAHSWVLGCYPSPTGHPSGHSLDAPAGGDVRVWAHMDWSEVDIYLRDVSHSQNNFLYLSPCLRSQWLPLVERQSPPWQISTEIFTYILFHFDKYMIS